MTGPGRLGHRVARLDARVEAVVDRLRNVPGVTQGAVVASHVGDWSLVWHLSGAVVGLLDADRADDAFRLSAVLGAESLLVNQGVKRLFRRSRPDGHDEAVEEYGIRRPTTSSFPSGHATSAFCAAVLLSDGGRRAPALWFGLAGAVAASRVVVKAHHASDVIGGAVIGMAIGAAVQRLWPPRRARTGR